uniref:Uncharacterized protein n=1 Tax=Arundo donax TaxID=35708 RepID=A0A0A9FQW1_ARUDO
MRTFKASIPTQTSSTIITHISFCSSLPIAIYVHKNKRKNSCLRLRNHYKLICTFLWEANQ